MFDHWLFDLENDPIESVNLLSDSLRSFEHSDMVTKLEVMVQVEREKMVESIQEILTSFKRFWSNNIFSQQE